MIASIVSFFCITGLLGHGLISLVTGRERMSAGMWVIAPGVGLALFAVLAILFNPLGVPLAWWTFLIAGLAFETAGWIRCLAAGRGTDQPGKTSAARPQPFFSGFRMSDFPWATAVAVALGAALFVIMLHGEFAAPWLNDDDSWEHASTAKYIALHGTYSISPEIRGRITSFIEPYPPAYPVLMGVMHQLNHSISWTLRFFNALLVALAIPWFFVAAKEGLAGNSKPENPDSNSRSGTALWMTAALCVIPCFMSHFVWAQTLAVALFFPAFYALERSRREPSWAIIAAVCIGAVAIAQPSAAAIFGVMAGLAWLAHFVSALFRRREPGRWRPLLLQAAAAAGALTIAAAFYVPEYVKFGHDEFFHGIGKMPLPAPKVGAAASSAGFSLNFAGTGGDVSYSLWDIAYSPTFLNRINQPIGIGLVLFAVAAAGGVLAFVRLKRTGLEPHWLVLLLWLGLGLVGIEGNHLHLSLFPFRFWVFFAIPVAMLAGGFLAWVCDKLSWKAAALAGVAGLALGGILVFSTLAERLSLATEMPVSDPRTGEPISEPFSARFSRALHAPDEQLEMPLAGTTGALLAVSILLAAGAAGLGFYRMRGPGQPLRFAGVAVLVAGVVLTSAYGKMRLEGFTAFPPGVRFYVAAVTYPDGRPLMLANGQPFRSREQGPEMQGYLVLQRDLNPDTPVLVLNGPDDHAVGFDMLALPYDGEILALRDQVDVVDPFGGPHAPVADEAYLKKAIALARAKGFRMVMVDLWRAADRQQEVKVSARALVAAAQQAKVPSDRLEAFFNLKAAPTDAEGPAVRGAFDRFRTLRGEELMARATAKRLRDLMRPVRGQPPRFDIEPTAVLDTGDDGVTIFAIREPKPAH